MKPWVHAKNSARKHGGKPEDYIKIHDFLDQTKMAHPDMRHRAILHNSLGCYLVEQVFGHNLTVTLADGRQREVSTREIAEEHIIEDMGRIPALSEYLDGMPMYDWLGGPKKKVTTEKWWEVD